MPGMRPRVPSVAPKVLRTASLMILGGMAVGHLIVICPELNERVTAVVERIDAPRHTPLQERRRRFSTEYLAAIDAIARQVPPQAEYGLLDVQLRESGGAYWVAYDLAPRRPVFLGRLHHGPLTWPDPERPLAGYVLAGQALEPPRLLDENSLAEFLENRRIGSEGD